MTVYSLSDDKLIMYCTLLNPSSRQLINKTTLALDFFFLLESVEEPNSRKCEFFWIVVQWPYSVSNPDPGNLFHLICIGNGSK